MKSLFEQMGGTYRQEGDYLIPNLYLPDEPDYQIGKYGRMRRSYLKEHRPVLYASLLTSGTLHRHFAEIDQACNERMAIIVSDMARQEDVTEALKAADQMEWVRRMNNIRSRAEEIVLTELVYEGQMPVIGYMADNGHYLYSFGAINLYLPFPKPLTGSIKSAFFSFVMRFPAAVTESFAIVP